MRPIATRVRRPSSWTMLLAGPIVGFGYFGYAYLLAEASCGELELAGTSVLRLLILAGAVAAISVGLLFAWRARQARQMGPGDDDDPAARDHRQNVRFMATTALMLAALFLLFVLFVTAPATGSTLC